MRPDQTAPPQPAPGVPRGAQRPGSGDPLELMLAVGLDAPAAARAAVTDWLSGRISGAMVSDAQLMVSELVANSVRHSGAAADAVLAVRAHVSADGVILEVHDQGTDGSIRRREPDMHAGGGFGLNVVETLSQRWGVNRDAGTRVWVELAFPAAA